MKGILCQLTDTQLIDVTHEFPRQNVRASAFWLREVIPHFPPAVHLAVVDPGVGTGRKAIVVRAGGHALVGPDNGLLIPPARALTEGSIEVFRVAVSGDGSGDPATTWPPDPASSTFHGRDVFAPTAGRVHEVGVDSLDTLAGIEHTDSYERVRVPVCQHRDDGLVGEVLAVDGFGNVITNVPGTEIRAHVGGQIEVSGDSVPVRRTYAGVDPNESLVTIGSHGNVELAVNQGRGDDAFGVAVGDSVHLR
jgi:S-adenosylmethionine hydrolase